MLNSITSAGNAAGQVVRALSRGALLHVLATLDFADPQAVNEAHQLLAEALAQDPLCDRVFEGVNRATIWSALAALELRRCADERGQPTDRIPGDRDADVLILASHLSTTGADELLQYYEAPLASHVLAERLAQGDWRCMAAHVYRARGEAHAQAGDYAQAIQAFKSGASACVLSGRDALATTFYGAAAAAAQEIADIVRRTRKPLQIGVAVEELAALLKLAGQTLNAARAFEEAARNFKEADKEAHAGKMFGEAAQCFYQEGFRSHAASCWEHAGDAYAYEDMVREAIKAFTMCLTVCKERGSDGDVLAAQASQKLANVLRRKGSFEAAKRADVSAAEWYHLIAKRKLNDADAELAAGNGALAKAAVAAGADAFAEAAGAWRSAKEYAREADAWDAAEAAYRRSRQLKKAIEAGKCAIEAGRRAIEAGEVVAQDVGPEGKRSADTWLQIAASHVLDGEDAEAAKAYDHAATALNQEFRPKQACHARRLAAQAWERLAQKEGAKVPRDHTAVTHAWDMASIQYKYAGEHIQAARALEMSALALREWGQQMSANELLENNVLAKADAVDRKAATMYWAGADELAKKYHDAANSGAARTKAAAVWERLGDHELAAGAYLQAAEDLRAAHQFTEARVADKCAARAYEKTADAAKADLRISARQRAGDIWWRLGKFAQAVRVYEQLIKDCYESHRPKAAQDAALSAGRAWVHVAEDQLRLHGDNVQAADAWKAAARCFEITGLRIEVEHALTQANKALADAGHPPVGT